MQAEMEILIITAASIACLHTVTGPDHYLPFIALSRSRGWSVSKTIFWTIFCGCGHVLSSVIIGLGGAAIGWSLSKTTWLQNVRGGIAGWCMLLFGLCYCLWGLYRSKQNKAHKHFDMYEDGSMYVYEHTHGHAATAKEKHKVTPWVMFIIFLLGPCEPMIPLLYFPAAKNSWWGMIVIVIVYTISTLAIMILMVILGYFGIGLVKAEKLEQHMHSIGGLTIFICGAGMIFLGW